MALFLTLTICTNKYITFVLVKIVFVFVMKSLFFIFFLKLSVEVIKHAPYDLYYPFTIAPNK